MHETKSTYIFSLDGQDYGLVKADTEVPLETPSRGTTSARRPPPKPTAHLSGRNTRRSERTCGACILRPRVRALGHRHCALGHKKAREGPQKEGLQGRSKPLSACFS